MSSERVIAAMNARPEVKRHRETNLRLLADAIERPGNAGVCALIDRFHAAENASLLVSLPLRICYGIWTQLDAEWHGDVLAEA